MELSKRVNEFGKTCEGLEQYSVQRFAKALQVSLENVLYVVPLTDPTTALGKSSILQYKALQVSLENVLGSVL